ncbi:DUF397 domain-containing protein [Streptomyces sp. NPDC088725]|uniref:DUF397 domain-containing protein n=1 Tax=Streptomyces sp. NPDC088725 TaxID=3365873 RepID=UPI0037F3BFB8
MSVEQDPRTIHWRKSSYSNDEGGSCLEVSDDFAGVVPVRDSKVPTGPVLMLTPGAWADFVSFATNR